MNVNRTNMLRIFPGLDKYWDKDDGKTFLEEFFTLYCYKIELYERWRAMQYEGTKAEPFQGLDVEMMRVRLVADQDDRRPYFTLAQEEFLDELDEMTVVRPVLLSDETTCKVLRSCLMRKTTDDINCEIMERRLRYAFAFKKVAKPRKIRYNKKDR